MGYWENDERLIWYESKKFIIGATHILQTETIDE